MVAIAIGRKLFASLIFPLIFLRVGIITVSRQLEGMYPCFKHIL